MNLSTEELRLLKLLFETESLSESALLLGMSASKASRILAKLRTDFADDLFTRFDHGMYATARARALRPQIERALEGLLQLEHMEAFSPASERRLFSIAGLDNGLLSYVAPALKRLREASGISIQFRPLTASFFEELRSARIDFAVYATEESFPGFQRQALCRDILVYAARSDHPFADRIRRGGTLGEEEVRSALSVLPVLMKKSSSDSGLIDFIEEVDIASPAVGQALFTPYFVSAAHVVLECGGVTLLPFQLVTRLQKTLPLALLGAPKSAKAFSPYLIWSEKRGRDPAMEWLRSVLVSAAQSSAVEIPEHLELA